HTINILAGINLVQGNINKSEELLKRSLSLARSKPWWPNYRIAAETYALLSKTYARKNNMGLAYLYSDSAMVAKDSLNVQFNALNMAKVQEKVDLVQRKLESEQLYNQKKLQLLIRNGLLTGILLLTIISILFINRQHLKQKK